MTVKISCLAAWMLLYAVPLYSQQQEAPHPKKGCLTTYHSNGMVMEEGCFNKAKKKEGLWKSYREGGMPLSMTYYRNGVQHGPVLSFSDHGHLEREEEYDEGKLTGSRRTYADHGILTGEEHYRKGKLHGGAKKFYGNGKLQDESNYTDGLKDGESKFYYETGQMATFYTYVKGIREGKAMVHYSNGQVKEEGLYANDEKEGEWREYDPRGTLLKTVIFQQGKVVREVE